MGNLTAVKVRNAKHSRRTRFHERLSDGGTLFLQLAPSGAKCWVQVVQVKGTGRRHTVGLGGYPLTSLAEAREAAFENRRAARRGIPPAKRKRGGRKPGAPTFEEAAAEVLATQSKAWKAGGKSEAQWKSSLAAYAHPVIGRMRVCDVTSADVVAVLKPIWTTKRETARRVKNRIGKVMDWAVVHGHRTDNPCQAVQAALPRMVAKPRHHRALPYADVPAAIAAVRASAAWRGTKLAFEFLTLTAARSGEVRMATWAEVDLDAKAWTVPAERAKTGREHRVPLSAAALDVLTAARELGAEGLVFPSVRGGVISDATIGKLLRQRGVDAVPHGFRSSFRDWGAEQTDHPREVLEAALAHKVPNAVEAAYARTDHYERRRALMDDWAAYLSA